MISIRRASLFPVVFHFAYSQNTLNLLNVEMEHCTHAYKRSYTRMLLNECLHYVELLMPMLRVSKDGDLEVIGTIDEGIYDFDVVAVDYGPDSSTLLKARSKVSPKVKETYDDLP